MRFTVPRAPNYLLRSDSQDDACSYCHVGSAHSSRVVYDLNSDGIYTANGHTIGASSKIPDSTESQWTEELTLETLGADGTLIIETINVRSYSPEKNSMYRMKRHHGQSAVTGAERGNYTPIGPVALGCMSCHQVHNAESQTWRSISMASMTNGGQYLNSEVSSYKLLKQFPSGTFVGELDQYGQVPLNNISIVPETTLTAGVNYDAVRAEGADPTPLALVRSGTSLEYNKPLWVAQSIERPGASRGERSDPAAVNNAALSVWCADCHNLNIGGSKALANPELGFKAHTERTHPSPFIGGFNGPGQCYSCHRSDLPSKNAGDACSQCHYGTGNYRENRWDPAGLEYVESDFPHSGENGGVKLLGSYSVDVENWAPTTIDEEVLVTSDNLDAVCLRCHWMEQQFHDGASSSGHSVPAEYAACSECHTGDAADIHAVVGCESCHEAAVVTNDCGTCHPDMLEDHGYDVAQHAATPSSDYVVLFAARTHDIADYDCEVLVDCNMCHSMDLGATHASRCSTCHPTPVDTFSTWNGSCQQGGCHPTYHADTLQAHWSTDDPNAAPYYGNCDNCHSPSWDVPASSCMNCHSSYSTSDTTPPVTTSDALASYIGPARITFSMTDSGKIGVGTTYRRLDGGAVTTGSSILVSSVGPHTIEFWSVDQAGNTEATHRTASFTIAADTTPPVTTSNALSAYYSATGITLTATDASTLGVKTTYYRLNGGSVQTGNYVGIPATPTGTISYTLVFWSEDWAGNVESPHTVTFTVTGGTGTIRLVWGGSDLLGPPGPGSEASWTVRRGSWTGSIVAIGSGSYPGWSGVDDIVVPVTSEPYFVVVDWWDDQWGYWDQTTFGNVYISTAGQLVRLSY